MDQTLSADHRQLARRPTRSQRDTLEGWRRYHSHLFSSARRCSRYWQKACAAAAFSNQRRPRVLARSTKPQRTVNLVAVFLLNSLAASHHHLVAGNSTRAHCALQRHLSEIRALRSPPCWQHTQTLADKCSIARPNSYHCRQVDLSIQFHRLRLGAPSWTELNCSPARPPASSAPTAATWTRLKSARCTATGGRRSANYQ